MPVPNVNAVTPFHQWSTAEPLIRGYPQWVGETDAVRIAAYQLYEQMYWNVPDTYKLTQRGSETAPIYIPAAMSIVEMLHRYLASGLSIGLDPAFGSDTEKALGQQVITDFVRRERFFSRFTANKRYGIIRGDWMWHIYADPNRPEGSRISIFPLDPGAYFPIYNPDNVDEIIGCHLVDPFTGDDGKERIRRLTYRKQTGTAGPSPIEVTDEVYEVDKWGGPGVEEGSPVEVVNPPQVLPSPIDQIPVYLIQNHMDPGTIFGSSELRGLERLFAAINQSISDEELALALEGLGTYATTAGEPEDDTGAKVGWNLGPGRVVQMPDPAQDVGKQFTRINGIGSVVPMQEHLAYLHRQLDEATGGSSIAKGRVDVAVAESGVALAIEFAPLLAKVSEKEQVITDVMANMLYDLRSWFAAYESFGSLENVRWMPSYGDKLPPNRDAQFKEIMEMVKAGLISATYARSQLRSLGYSDMPDDTQMMDEILTEKEMVGRVEADAEGARIDAMLGGDPAASAEVI